MTPGLFATADGVVFRGRSVGAPGIATGEAVFTTSMTGYQEVLTDPSYAGQVVVMTAPHIGNYGMSSRDDQAERVRCRGFVMRALSRRHSGWRAQGSLRERLVGEGVVALDGVDTRRLTRHLRDRGAMPVALGSDADERDLIERAAAEPGMSGRDLASAVSTQVAYVVPPAGPRRLRVAALDLGIKRDIVRRLAARGIETTVLPMATAPETILDLDPDGVFVSNGPGDPEPLAGPIATVRALLGEVPVFGVCLGHQVLGLALGARTYKLPFGHHGANHPVRRLGDGRVEVTAQNHGFAVDLGPLGGERPFPDGAAAPPGPPPGPVETEVGTVVATHVNLNDGTLEGLACRRAAAFSVQYHPEAAPGPHDADHLFDRFVSLMEGSG